MRVVGREWVEGVRCGGGRWVDEDLDGVDEEWDVGTSDDVRVVEEGKVSGGEVQECRRGAEGWRAK